MSLEQRVTQLEQEVQALRAQMAAMQQTSDRLKKPRIKRDTVAAILDEKPVVQHDVTTTTDTVQPVKKPSRSLEQWLASLLPKVFMVILVLGVVWGLKVMSDYGFFGDTMKITSAYALSLAMLGIAYWKQSQWGTAAIDSLFGGAFIVGILTTAAGAILYDVLSQTVALLIALLYIAYGVAISYVRRNEVLTSFVFFTSLLLPYLLDYMNMSKPIIFMYIVVMFALMQMVIMKHTQWVALMIGFIASVSTLTFFLWEGDAKVSWALLIVLIIMAAVSAYMMERSIPKRPIRLWLFISYAVALWIFAMEDQLVPVLALVVLLVAITGYLLKQRILQGADVFYPLAVCSVVLLAILLTTNDHVLLFVLPFTFVATMFYAWRCRLKISSVVLTAATFIMFGIVYMTLIEEPTDAVSHVQYVLLLLYALAGYIYVHRRHMTYGSGNNIIHVANVLAGILVLLWIGYSASVDALFHIGNFAYVTYGLMTLLLLVHFVMPKRWLSSWVTYIVTGAWLLFSLSYLSSTWTPSHATLHIVAQLSVLIILGFFIWRVMRQNDWAHMPRSWRLIGIIAYMYMMYVAFVNQLFMMDAVSTSVRMMLHTMMLFGVAGAYMALHQYYNERIYMRLGMALLAIALVKLLIVDLVAINIFIRAILFMIVGAIGFYLSTRLRKKHSES